VIGYRRGLDLDGSVVAVTGAASGIGRATVLALAERGARPVLLGPPGDAQLEAAPVLTHGHALVPGLTEWLVAELAVSKATFRARGVRKVAFRTQPDTRRRAGG
jgi:NAD(P)-dependent dehydrogenase (short-subunit alcohol dehydrogenase family)